MTQYRQILRLHSQGISQRSIAQSCQCSRNTVAAVHRHHRVGIMGMFRDNLSHPLRDTISHPEFIL